jgi:uncharacterized membrane protein YtjA (UPF0391 family)
MRASVFGVLSMPHAVPVVRKRHADSHSRVFLPRQNLGTNVLFSGRDVLTQLASKGLIAGWAFAEMTAVVAQAALGLRPGEQIRMLNWALIFFIVAIIAAIFGFGGVAFAAAGIAKILFFLFLVLFVISLVAGVTRRV